MRRFRLGKTTAGPLLALSLCIGPVLDARAEGEGDFRRSLEGLPELLAAECRA